MELSKKTQQHLPYNYQYALASALYKIFDLEDEQLAENLHSNRSGKFFTFSWIQYQRGTSKNGLDFKNAWFYVSSPDNRFINVGARGLLNHPYLLLNGIPLEVTGLEAMEVVKMGGVARFRTLSPIYLKKIVETTRDKRFLDLYPGNEEWEKMLRRNLVSKFESYTRERCGDIDFHVKQINRVKRKRMDIAGSYRRCAMLEFTVESDPDLLRFGYDAGFGEKNAMGFGCVEVMDQC